LIREVLPVPAVELQDFPYALAQEIADNAPLSIRAANTILNRTTNDEPITTEGQAYFADMWKTTAVSEDLEEGISAFLENWRPQFIDC